MRRTASGLLAGVAVAVGACAPDDSATLQVATTFGEEGRAVAERLFEQAHPGWSVHFVEAGAGPTGGSEEGAVDVWWGIPIEQLDAAARAGALALATPSWASRVRAGAADPDGFWHAVALSPIVLAFNRDQVPLSRAPRDWIDLFHPRWRGDLALPDGETTPTGRALIAGAMVEELRRISVEQAGWDWLLRLDAAAAGYRQQEEELLRDIRTGGSTFAVLPAHRLVGVGGSWLMWRPMESGVPFLARGVGVSAATPNPAPAQGFLEVAGQAPVLAAIAAAEGWVPALEGVEPSDDPFGGRARDLRLWALAPDTTLRRADEWADRWGETVRHRGRRYY